MEQQAIDTLAAIPVGTLISWIALGSIIICGFCAAAIKAYKFFEKFKQVKDDKEKLQQTVKAHENKLAEVDTKLTTIINMLNAQNETTIKQLRSELVRDGERYIVAKKMTIREWKSFIERYGEYHDPDKFNQNSYVESLKNRIEREVKIIGSLDEHGNDIDK